MEVRASWYSLVGIGNGPIRYHRTQEIGGAGGTKCPLDFSLSSLVLSGSTPAFAVPDNSVCPAI
jgi:hypothetical protein